MYDNYMGVIQALGFQFAPENWAYCNGAIILITQQTALYSLLGCEFGGNCTSVFGYPDLRGRLAMGQGQGPGLSLWQVGMMPGEEETYLSLVEMPTHTHPHTYGGSAHGGATVEIEVATQLADSQIPGDGDYIGVPSNTLGTSANGQTYAAAAAATTTVPIGGVSAAGGGGGFQNTLLSISSTGLNAEVSVMAPSQVVNYCLCIDGYYPSRS
ncbi:phage tail protein [Kordiimonas marina]|uniref:phage tail protein n=1 Tax=Kordiimonas marina TaxID=2872312 RepID=UPI001FF38827|nr:tail fiber protein [Kordiimonas marina]MCJ9429436.1 tail fiber protein [Kordiimonas marina]